MARLFLLSGCRSSSTGSGSLQILKNNIQELMIEKLTKTNTRGIVGNKNNKNSSNRMDLTCLLQIRLSLENNKDSFINFLILLVS